MHIKITAPHDGIFARHPNGRGEEQQHAAAIEADEENGRARRQKIQATEHHAQNEAGQG